MGSGRWKEDWCACPCDADGDADGEAEGAGHGMYCSGPAYGRA